MAQQQADAVMEPQAQPASFDQLWRALKATGLVYSVIQCVLRTITNGAEDSSVRIWVSPLRHVPLIGAQRDPQAADEPLNGWTHYFLYPPSVQEPTALTAALPQYGGERDILIRLNNVNSVVLNVMYSMCAAARLGFTALIPVRLTEIWPNNHNPATLRLIGELNTRSNSNLETGSGHINTPQNLRLPDAQFVDLRSLAQVVVDLRSGYLIVIGAARLRTGQITQEAAAQLIVSSNILSSVQGEPPQMDNVLRYIQEVAQGMPEECAQQYADIDDSCLNLEHLAPHLAHLAILINAVELSGRTSFDMYSTDVPEPQEVAQAIKTYLTLNATQGLQDIPLKTKQCLKFLSAASGILNPANGTLLNTPPQREAFVQLVRLMAPWLNVNIRHLIEGVMIAQGDGDLINISPLCAQVVNSFGARYHVVRSEAIKYSSSTPEQLDEIIDHLNTATIRAMPHHVAFRQVYVGDLSGTVDLNGLNL